MSQLNLDEIHSNPSSLDMSQLDHDEIGSKFEKRRGMFFIIIIIIVIIITIIIIPEK